MPQVMRKKLSALRFFIIWIFRRSSLEITRVLLLSVPLRSRILLSYNQGPVPDGLGAQIQRMVALNALGAYLQVKVIHPDILEVAIHPMDNMSKAGYQDMLIEIKTLLSTKDESGFDNFLKYQVTDLRSKHFLVALFKSIVNKQVVNLSIRDSYFLVDSKPELYKKGISSEMKKYLRSLADSDFFEFIALHHRHGVGNMAIQPGQSKPREIDMRKYINPLRQALVANNKNEIVIFTDAPETDLEFSPSLDQARLWEGLPQFDGERMKISAGQFKELESEFPNRIRIVRGGNPLKTLANLSTAGSIILSRSSFGYLAALFASHDSVWIPSDFWHPKHKYWKQY